MEEGYGEQKFMRRRKKIKGQRVEATLKGNQLAFSSLWMSPACPRGASEIGNEVPVTGVFQNGNLVILPLQGAKVQSRLNPTSV